jgi:hypothetical protein
MKTPLDIFRKEPNSLVWIAAVENAVAAKAMIDRVRLSKPGEYVVFSQETGKCISRTVNPNIPSRKYNSSN